MVDHSAVGATDAPFEMVVERGKIREFARATMATSREYFDQADTVAPPTFLTSAQFWAPPGETAVRRVGLDLKRVLHGGQEYVFHGPPPRAGTPLTAHGRIDTIYEKEGRRGGTMTFVETVQEFRDPSGRVVAESRSIVIETGRAPTEDS